MTVAELVAKLQGLNPNYKVIVECGSDYSDATDISTMSMVERGGYGGYYSFGASTPHEDTV